MKISYKWLQEYFKDPLPSQEGIAEILTMKAYEVSGIENGILDLDILPNRSSDSLGYLGVAQELSVLLDQELKLPEIKYETDSSQKTSDFISLRVDDQKLAPRAMKRIVFDVKVGDSPNWLKERLVSIGQRSINNVVDITNFVMWETGQPVHAFDLDKVAQSSSKNKEVKVFAQSVEREITIRSAQKGEKITILDGGEYELQEGMLVIADSKKALDIAGIKGGIATGIDNDTKQVMLSVCNFNPTSIRKTSRALNLRTDASSRFEQGISPTQTRLALERLSQLVSELSGARVLEEFLDIYSEEAKNQTKEYEIGVTLEKINKVLGSEMSNSDIENILNRFSRHANFKWRLNGENFIVSVPKTRLDLKAGPEPLVSGNPEDLIEEIGRVYGYENIKSALPAPLTSKVNKTFYYVELLKDILINNGFSEVITYSFQDKGEAKVANPLARDKKYLRNSLERGLLKALELNNKNKPLFGKAGVKFFEVGNIFEKNSESLSLGVATEEKEAMNSVRLELEKILGVGALKNHILTFKIDPERLPEINSYENLAKDLTKTKEFKEISPYPFVLRDVAFWTDGDVEVNEIEEIIKETAGGYLVNINLFDTYEKEGRVSFAFNLVFQSSQKTLTDNEVGNIMEQVETALKEHGCEVR